MVVAFSLHTPSPLDGCLYASQATIQHLTRSALHRCLQRHGIRRLPGMTGDKADRPTAVAFLESLHEAVPCGLNVTLTDNDIQFTDLPRNRDGRTARMRVHRFDKICREHEIEHRLTKPNHPWTNGQEVERMHRTIKNATGKRYHYDSHNHT